MNDIKNTYNDLPSIPVEFSIKYLNVETLSGYTSEFGTLTFEPNFLTAPAHISDSNYFFDFGDGNTSNMYIPTYSYEYPGDYLITLVVSDSAGNLYKSDFSRYIKIYDYIGDKIVLTHELSSNEQCFSEITNKITVNRFNSFRTMKDLSGSGYNVKLSVDGNESKFYDKDSYSKDKRVQFKRGSFFVDKPTPGFSLMDSVSTNNTNIYGIALGGVSLVTTEPLPGSVLLGCSGSGTFYYYED